MDFDQQLTFHELANFCERLALQEKKSTKGRGKRDQLLAKFFKTCREKMPPSDSNQSLFPLMRLLIPYLDKRVYK